MEFERFCSLKWLKDLFRTSKFWYFYNVYQQYRLLTHLLLIICHTRPSQCLSATGILSM
jgi:hypothetical protein